MTRFHPFRLTGVAVCIAAFQGCSDLGPAPTGLEAEVAEHRRLWDAVRPTAYTFELERQCYCADDARGPVRLSVEGTLVLGRTYSGSGVSVSDDFSELFPSIDGLFDVLEDAIRRSAADVQVTWDESLGVPSHFFIDYSTDIADEELGFRIVAGPETS